MPHSRARSPPASLLAPPLLFSPLLRSLFLLPAAAAAAAAPACAVVQPARVQVSAKEYFYALSRSRLVAGPAMNLLLALVGFCVVFAVFDQPVIQLDLNATALAAAGIEEKHEWNLDGVNLLPFLDGKKSGPPHDALFWRFGEQMAVRSGDWKLVRYDAVADGGAARRGAVSLLKLYNLASDIHEDKDLAAAMPDKAKELQAKWDVWNKSNIKPLWGNGAGDNDGPEPGASPRNNRPARKANANAANGKNL